MPTIVSQSTLDELGRLIADACEKGDNVAAIAKRAGLPREKVSRIKNGTYTSSPTLETVEGILKALDLAIIFGKCAKR